jgi:hypothetical protein
MPSRSFKTADGQEAKGADYHDADQSMRFKCIGGPLHEVIVRVWPPYDLLEFHHQGDTIKYTLSPPLRKNGMWVYVHEEDANAQ